MTVQPKIGAPNPLAQHYRLFGVEESLHLTGHSHQAWPDVAFEGQKRAWLDAAELLDSKWERAFAQADRVCTGFSRLLDDQTGDIALGVNTHELLVRFLSALPLRERPRLVTTTGEFHTIRRQLDRLAEEGLEVEKVSEAPASLLSERLAAAVDDRTAAVLVSSVLFANGHIVPGLDTVAKECERVGARLLVDTYHALNAVPFSISDQGLENAFVVGGGYKYCQLGEGNCFMRIPPACSLRPIVTGWYSEFGTLSQEKTGGVEYGEGAARFAGATYDPTSHYRGAAVFDFFDDTNLNPQTLRTISQHQVGLLADRFDALDLNPDLVARDRAVSLDAVGGFLALQSPVAGAFERGLRDVGVSTDHRDQTLRFGPAPYHSDDQLIRAMELLGEVAPTVSIS